MNFIVSGFKAEKFENKHGMEMQEDKVIGESEHVTTTQAERAAKALYDQGADTVIITSVSGKDDAARYWNPRVGISATPANWVEDFEAGYEV